MFNNINIKSTPKTNFGGKLHFLFHSRIPFDVYYTFNLQKIQKKFFPPSHGRKTRGHI